jgi:hypothetical protein
MKVGDIVKSKNNPTAVYKVVKVYGIFKSKVDVVEIHDVSYTYRNFNKSLFYKV